MDFAAQYAFGTHQAYPTAFMPLTPSHSQSAGSDDFTNTSPP
ncbi:bzip transcription factor, partial [Trichoderma arundinaceum]